MNTKMNTLLAKAEHLQAQFNQAISNYAGLFKNKQGMFRGQRKTFAPKEGFPEDPSKICNIQVATTVDEQWDWLIKNILKPFFEEQFSIEATNSIGAKKVPLIVDGVNFGNLSALSLMRLKTLLSNCTLLDMYKNMPVRSDSEVWTKSQQPDYADRAVYETPMLSGVTRTTENQEFIMKDPNLDPAHLPANYNAKTTIKKVTLETGDYTMQNYSGEWTQTQKAQLLAKLSRIQGAIITAMKEVNDVETVPSDLDVDALLKFIHSI